LYENFEKDQDFNMDRYMHSLRANPLACSPEQVKLNSNKWKLWKNLFE